MRKKISVTLAPDLPGQIDQHLGNSGSRSALIETVLRNCFEAMKRQAINQRDLEIINANDEYLNSEMEDMLQYQAPINSLSKES